jgi:hypothetical protein
MLSLFKEIGNNLTIRHRWWVLMPSLLLLLTACQRSDWDPTVKVNATQGDILTPVTGREAKDDAGTAATSGIRLGEDANKPHRT